MFTLTGFPLDQQEENIATNNTDYNNQLLFCFYCSLIMALLRIVEFLEALQTDDKVKHWILADVHVIIWTMVLMFTNFESHLACEYSVIVIIPNYRKNS